jgi:hypothetical protein
MTAHQTATLSNAILRHSRHWTRLPFRSDQAAARRGFEPESLCTGTLDRFSKSQTRQKATRDQRRPMFCAQ